MRKTWVPVCALCAALLLTGVDASAKDNAKITADEAKEAAWKMVPSSCAYLTTDRERYLYEVKYFDKTNQQKYTVQVGMTKGDILELTVQSAAQAGGKSVQVSAAQAEQEIRALYSDAISIQAELTEVDGLYFYTVRYKTPFTLGAAKLNAETGHIIERDDVYFQEKNEELRGVVKTAATAGSLTRLAVSQADIEKNALAAVPGGAIDRIQLTGDRTLYEVKMHKGDYEYELLYNAATGARLSLSSAYDPADLQDEWYQNPGAVQKAAPSLGMKQIADASAKSAEAGQTYISRDKAKQIAQRSAPSGALVKSMSLKSSDGNAYYEGWLKKDGIRYGFRIDAVDGSIIDASTEVDETWDPDAHHDVDSLKDEDKDYEMKWDD